MSATRALERAIAKEAVDLVDGLSVEVAADDEELRVVLVDDEGEVMFTWTITPEDFIEAYGDEAPFAADGLDAFAEAVRDQLDAVE